MRRAGASGFTLVELLVVVAIIIWRHTPERSIILIVTQTRALKLPSVARGVLRHANPRQTDAVLPARAYSVLPALRVPPQSPYGPADQRMRGVTRGRSSEPCARRLRRDAGGRGPL